MAGGYSLGVQAGVSNSSRQQQRASVESSALEKIFSQKTEFNKARSAAYAVIAAAKIREKGETERNTLDNMFDMQKSRLAAESAWNVANLEDKQKRDKTKMEWDKALIEEGGRDERHTSQLLKEMGYDPSRTLLGAKMWKAVTEGRASLSDFANLVGGDTPNNLRKDADDRRAQANKDRDVMLDIEKERAVQGRSDRDYSLRVNQENYKRGKDKNDTEYNRAKDERDFTYRSNQDRVGNAYKTADIMGKASKGMKEYFDSPEFVTSLMQKYGIKDQAKAQVYATSIKRAADAMDNMTKRAGIEKWTPERVNLEADAIFAQNNLDEGAWNIMEPYVKARTVEQQAQADLSGAMGYHVYDIAHDPNRIMAMKKQLFKAAPETKSKFQQIVSYGLERFSDIPGFSKATRDFYGNDGLDSQLELQMAKERHKATGESMQDSLKYIRENAILTKGVGMLPNIAKKALLAHIGDSEPLRAEGRAQLDEFASLGANYIAARLVGPMVLKGAKGVLQGTSWLAKSVPIINKVTAPMAEAAESALGKGIGYIDSKLTAEGGGAIQQAGKNIWDELLSRPKQPKVGDSLESLIQHDWEKGLKPRSNLGVDPVDFPSVKAPEGPPAWSNEGPAWAPPEAPWGPPVDDLVNPASFNPRTVSLEGINLNPQPMPSGALIKGPKALPRPYDNHVIPELPVPPGPPGEIIMSPMSPRPGTIDLRGMPPEPQLVLPPAGGTSGVPFETPPIPQPGSIMESYNPGPASTMQSPMHADLTPPPEALLADELARSIKQPDPAVQMAEQLRMMPPEAPPMPPEMIQPAATTMPEPPVGSQSPQGFMVRDQLRAPVKGVNPEADVFTPRPQVEIGKYYQKGPAGGAKQYERGGKEIKIEGHAEEFTDGGRKVKLRLADGTLSRPISASRLAETLDPRVETASLKDLISQATQVLATQMEYFASVGVMDAKKLSVSLTQMTIQERGIFQQAMTTGNMQVMLALLKKYQ